MGCSISDPPPGLFLPLSLSLCYCSSMVCFAVLSFHKILLLLEKDEQNYTVLLLLITQEGQLAHTHTLPIMLSRWQMYLVSSEREQQTFNFTTNATSKFTSIFNLTPLMSWHDEYQYFIPLLLTVCKLQ